MKTALLCHLKKYKTQKIQLCELNYGAHINLRQAKTCQSVLLFITTLSKNLSADIDRYVCAMCLSVHVSIAKALQLDVVKVTSKNVKHSKMSIETLFSSPLNQIGSERNL